MPAHPDASVGRAAVSKARRRLIPFMFLLYIVSYLDRVNVGFAALQMNADLGFSATVYGFGAGIFFLGYVLFEIPSNLILARVGARLWIARIMITWGLISSATMLVEGPASFYTLRFLLGAAEAGFFPGMILYLTYWFPAAERARTIALFMTATALAGVVGGPLSGALLSMHGLGGLAGWQWLFLVEGVPAVALGLVVLGYLTDRPEHADWLTAEERAWLADHVAREQQLVHERHRLTMRQAFTNGRVWRLCLVYFAIVVGFYGISFWLPQIIKGLSGLDDWLVGLVSAIPSLVSAIAMVVVARHSDETGERRWHVAGPALVATIGFVASASVRSPVMALVALSVAASGVWGALGPFWTLPTAFLSGTAAAGGIALINSIGNVGGFVGPYAVGWIRDATGSFAAGLLVLAAALSCGAAIAASLPDQS